MLAEAGVRVAGSFLISGHFISAFLVSGLYYDIATATVVERNASVDDILNVADVTKRWQTRRLMSEEENWPKWVHLIVPRDNPKPGELALIPWKILLSEISGYSLTSLSEFPADYVPLGTGI